MWLCLVLWVLVRSCWVRAQLGTVGSREPAGEELLGAYIYIYVNGYILVRSCWVPVYIYIYVNGYMLIYVELGAAGSREPVQASWGLWP